MASSSEQPAALAEGRRIYLGNLLYSVQPVEIEEMLKDNGFEGYEQIHISMDPVTARNPGYCFVDFSDRGDAERALASLEARLRGRPLKVGPCEPKKQNRSRWQSDREPAFNRWGDWSGQRKGDGEQREAPARPAGNSGIENGPYGAIKHFDEVAATDNDGRRLYVGGLDSMVDQAQHQDEMQQILEGHKPLAISKRITPHESTKAKGGNHHYCFVDFATVEEADAAKDALDRKVWGTGRLRVNIARALPDKLKDRTTPADVQNDQNAAGERSPWRKPRFDNSNNSTRYKQRSHETSRARHLVELENNHTPPSVVFLGDSMIERLIKTGLSPSFDPWPSPTLISDEVIAQYQTHTPSINTGRLQGVFNAGVGGDKFENVIYRLVGSTDPSRPLVGLLEALQNRGVKLWVLHLGTNNLHPKHGMRKADLDLLGLIIEALLDMGGKVLLVGLFRRKDIKDELVTEANENYIELIKQIEKGRPDRIQFLEPPMIDMDECLADHVHLNQGGYQIWAEVLLKAVKNTLQL
ncbi:RNA recognition domain-containing protein [Colletotrichum orchidophilum]|uniref:RNA recognition domain-containing protein n=1 Tax=Colletotrichum orchidophilum TaxID=1209926 RepID=A0A1G4BHL5_9PEZI|nr:RNA recognition domain-containing protein [Colletotrichum orchidophilum]OHF00909.1 RNA recognition domain-containing protein [Colletotrichum orchidophilum]